MHGRPALAASKAALNAHVMLQLHNGLTKPEIVSATARGYIQTIDGDKTN